MIAETEQRQQRMDTGPFRLLIRDRTVSTIILAAVFVLAFAFGRRDFGDSGMTEDYLWTMKIEWSHCADMLNLGDSRSLTAVFPGAMQPYFPGLRILNYAFGATGYSESYLRSAERVLDPQSRRKAIILAITPLSLTEVAAKRNAYTTYAAKTSMDRRRTRLFSRLVYFFRPTRLDDILATLSGKKKPVQRFRRFRRDGSSATYTVPETPSRALNQYRGVFDPTRWGPVSSDIMELIYETVTEWRHKGITVFAFRPPTFPGLAELEDEESGFKEQQFIDRFEKAGGRWISFSGKTYRTHDGSHLHPEGATEFSRDLAEKIQALWT